MEKAFSDYVARMAEIRSLSLPEIHDVDSAEEYRNRLCSNSDAIGRLARQNRAFLRETLYPLLEGEDPLSPETASDLQSLAEQLFFVGGKCEDQNLDLPVMSLIIRRLLRDAERKGDLSRQFELNKLELFAHYGLMDMTRRIITSPQIAQTFARRGFEAALFCLHWVDAARFVAIEDPENRVLVLNNLRFASNFLYYGRGGLESVNAVHLDALDRVAELAGKPLYRQGTQGMDWRYYDFRLCEYYQELTDMGNVRGFDRAQLARIADMADVFESLCASDPEYFSHVLGYSNVGFRCARNRYLAGRLPEAAYMDTLLTVYKSHDPADYSTDGAIINILIPAEILSVLRRRPLSREEQALITKLYVNLLRYMFKLPNSGALSVVMNYFTYIVFHFVEVPGGISFEAFCVQALAALHPPTYIHVRMVSHISECLCRHLMAREPRRFIGVLDCASDREVRERAEEIARFTRHAACCHDYGKIPIIDTIFMYGRGLLDAEYDIIRAHSELSCALLSRVPSTRPYADVALGHHRFYDGRGGYPEGFDAAASPVRAIIDIVCCADCLDAATDTVGRSYSRGKSLEMLIGELEAGSGTRYAPYVVSLIRQPEVRRDIEDLLSRGREQVYQETFTLLRRLRKGESPSR